MRNEKNKLTALLICLALCSGLLCGCSSGGKAYSEAADLFASGAYDAAYEAFIDLGDYRDSAEMAAKCADARFEAEYRSAVDLMDNGDIAEAIAAFEALAGYSDSAEKAEKCREALRASDYADALALMEAERFGEAASIFLSLGDYSDSAGKALECSNLESAAVLAKSFAGSEVGAVVMFGSYEQDGKSSNGPEPISWIVVSRTESSLMLLSRYGLDSRQYMPETVDTTWETSEMRAWLNSDFFTAAFNTVESSLVMETEISTPDNPVHLTVGGNDTLDRVFLLSMDEASSFFDSDEARQCVPTPYAVNQGAYVYEDTGSSLWWLRTPGYVQSNVTFIGFRGYDTDYHGYRVSHGDSEANSKGVVRPAIWVYIG